jgi:hypothetical protein
MILVDPENLADTGIDIVASQKANALLLIGQLSGGENADSNGPFICHLLNQTSALLYSG